MIDVVQFTTRNRWDCARVLQAMTANHENDIYLRFEKVEGSVTDWREILGSKGEIIVRLGSSNSDKVVQRVTAPDSQCSYGRKLAVAVQDAVTAKFLRVEYIAPAAKTIEPSAAESRQKRMQNRLGISDD